MSTFLVTYIRKNPFELPEVHTPEHQHSVLKFCAQIQCSDSVLKFCAQILCYHSHHQALLRAGLLFSLHFSPGGYYLLCTAHWWILSLVHSALVGYYLLCTAHWWGLSLAHSALVGIIPPFFS